MDQVIPESLQFTAEDIPQAVMILPTIDAYVLYALACIGTCMGIRKAQENGVRHGRLFSVKSPYASMVGSVLCCVFGQVSISLLTGSACATFQQGDWALGTPMVAWYIVNHSPLDMFWEIVDHRYVYQLLGLIVNHRRVRNTLIGFNIAKSTFSGSCLSWIIGGLLYSSGGSYFAAYEKGIRGVHGNSELLNPGRSTRSSIVFGIFYTLCELEVLGFTPDVAMVLCVYYEMAFGILSILSGNILDPLEPVVNAVCFLMCGEIHWFNPIAPDTADKTQKASAPKTAADLSSTRAVNATAASDVQDEDQKVGHDRQGRKKTRDHEPIHTRFYDRQRRSESSQRDVEGSLSAGSAEIDPSAALNSSVKGGRANKKAKNPVLEPIATLEPPIRTAMSKTGSVSLSPGAPARQLRNRKGASTEL
ncbi:hypothetical protein SARC_11117 [Sphaeroforma arctica JP610]|uniref:Uncharacterized protein n=1 Tax=Sphaeroforma arctica JP610 TaxID=667725 RepID=A0A0L0FIS7_9EUKA|nr:hypothetical protein SARC_11117 [Sphaeroforma arctica JP610]KNC76381.1 hypothetical protein SARC_11117 [Sphaeroforma arctica JP610]|eukprot:XP_014150283.1 hypothetical protein SARC_11117 [Sphaeroforma arctica JP610]